jgi:Domain of unknown function (DUF4465)/Secretion system C-terminal sorting domain
LFLNINFYMRTFTLVSFALLVGTNTLRAQTVASFEDLTLSKPTDTSYINYTPATSGMDVGFNDGLAHFPCVYDTSSFGNYWNYGFSYSDWTDSVTSGYTNQYASKTAIGYSGSAKYAVAYCFNPVTYTNNVTLPLRGAAMGEPVNGFYVTNSTYAYNSMMRAYPSEPPAKKFDSGDWFLLTIKGYSGGTLTTDSVNFYLADFRASDSTTWSAVRTWQWVNLLPLGHVDSLWFNLTSSDTGAYGMNTPAYFCMDNFTTDEGAESIGSFHNYVAKVYPNPANDMLYADINDNSIEQVSIINMAGQVAGNYTPATHIAINISSLPSGTYMLQLTGKNGTANTKFIKQ